MLDILYYTDNKLDPFLFEKCQEKLTEAADGKTIISVSQKSLDFGKNICIGDIGRSHLSLFTQILTGAQASNADFIALAEHDCLYSPEHFNWIPPDNSFFYYNLNHWLCQWGGKVSGVYSYKKRRVLSNLICNRELLIEHVQRKVDALKAGAEIRRGIAGACEFGVVPDHVAMSKTRRMKDLGKGIGLAKGFRTEIPNVDIRHGGNFSGGRRAKKQRYSIPYWGDIYSALDTKPPGKWYQEAVINGEAVQTRRKHDTNEKRWQTFIEPHIQMENGIVQDLGCNAGFYCRKMVERGFKAIGVEREPEFIRHNRFWETQDPRGTELVTKDITKYEPVCSHYAFLANVHYWLTPEQLDILVSKLRERVLNVVVISRFKQAKEHNSPVSLSYLKELFSGWQMSEVIEKGKHFSLMFTNPDLTVKDIEKIFPKQQLARSKKFLPSYSKLVDDVVGGKKFDPKETDYYKYLEWRGFGNKDERIKRHIELIKDMNKLGYNEPLTIGRVVDNQYEPDRLYDGDHRFIVARKLGMANVICKINEG